MFQKTSVALTSHLLFTIKTPRRSQRRAWETLELDDLACFNKNILLSYKRGRLLIFRYYPKI